MIQRLIEGFRGHGGPADAEGRIAPKEPLLTDEESVVSVLEDNGGVTWQSHFVTETTWSESKVSRVLCRMDDEGSIRRYRVGRRNLVSLPGREPDFVKRDYDSLA